MTDHTVSGWLGRPAERTKREGREVAGVRRGVLHCQCDQNCVRTLNSYFFKCKISLIIQNSILCCLFIVNGN